MDEIVVVTTTLDDRGTAEALGTAAVAGRYAACAQLVGPITSIYRWQGDLENGTEWQLVCKTAADRAGDLVDFLAGGHPYQVPEIVVTPVVGGNPAYAGWVRTETRP